MRLKNNHRRQGREISCDPAILDWAACMQGIWHETEVEIDTALVAGHEKALLLRWVRREMRRRLTPRERRFLEQHYFKALNASEVARQNGVHKATVSRTLRKAVEKLRRAARENGHDTPEDAAVIRAMKNRCW